MIRSTACIVAQGTDPYRNLALEKHLMDTLPEDTAILYLWQNEHTIVVGRNQNPWQECQVEAFLRAGGAIARRLSGGGAVYHDAGNLNFTFILPKGQFDVMRQLSVIAMAAGRFGLRPQLSGRNDLLLDGRKFSGNAYYRAGHSAYHHGTLLVNTDLSAMAQYLTVDPQKLAARGVRSVPSRVVNLSELNPDVTVEELERALYFAFGEVYRCRPSFLDENMFDRPTLEDLAARFADPEWIYPQQRPYTFSVSERFPWGGVTVKLLVENSVIQCAKVFTDAMEVSIFERLEQALTGCPYLISAIAGRVEQKLAPTADSASLLMAKDAAALICGKMRNLDRAARTDAANDTNEFTAVRADAPDETQPS